LDGPSSGGESEKYSLVNEETTFKESEGPEVVRASSTNLDVRIEKFHSHSQQVGS